MDAEFIYPSAEYQKLVDAEIERWAETLSLLAVND